MAWVLALFQNAGIQRPVMTKNTETLWVRLPPGLKHDLEKKAARESVPVSIVVRRLIINYLSTKP